MGMALRNASICVCGGSAGVDEETLLECVYRDEFADSREDILQSATILAYAKPLLIVSWCSMCFSGRSVHLSRLPQHHSLITGLGLTSRAVFLSCVILLQRVQTAIGSPLSGS